MAAFVTISGPPGAGKTSLSKCLADRLHATLVCFDDYETITRLPPREFAAWQASGSPYAPLMTPALLQALEHGLEVGSVVFDTPLGTAAPLPRAPDLAVWIDLPPDLALARKLSQIIATVPPQESPDFLRWLSEHLVEYEKITHPQVQLMQKRVASGATLTLSGQDELPAMVEACTNCLIKVHTQGGIVD